MAFPKAVFSRMAFSRMAFSKSAWPQSTQWIAAESDESSFVKYLGSTSR